MTKKADLTTCLGAEDIIRIRHQHIIKHKGPALIQEAIADARKRNEDWERSQGKVAGPKPKPPKRLPQIKLVPCMFPNRYEKGELPCTIEHGAAGHYLSWVCPLEQLDYSYYLPMFFDGLRCTQEPCSFLARQGIEDLLFAARGSPDKILTILPKLATFIRNAMATYNRDILMATTKALRLLVTCNEGVGEALVPFYKLFLAPLNLFLDDVKNTGDAFDYGQRRNNDCGEECRLTLETMERTGGPTAFRTIKQSVPTYESCCR